jgi:hypothetical protein
VSALTDLLPRTQQRRPITADAIAASLAALALFVLYAAQGFPTLTDARGDNDSLMRLVEVRDLIGGQGWFDLHQYRMGLEGGFVMHWSRLVDAPIALIILAAQAMGASPATADHVAGVVWPLALFAAALFFLLRIVRRLGNAHARLPGVVIGAVSLYATGIFVPGNLDHHNAQLVLTLAMLWFLIAPEASFRSGALAGACAALMLAVGMETVPYIAAGGAAVALSMLLLGRAERFRAAGFGAALSGLSLAVMAATVRPSEWSAVHCDAFSTAQFAAAAIAGCGLALVALLPVANCSLPRRGAALMLLALVLAAAALALFPQCLAGPYAAMPLRLREHWLDFIGEAQPATNLLVNGPVAFCGNYVTPFIGLAAAMLFEKRCRSREWLVVAGLLAMTVLVSLWQVRGAMFSVPLAAVPLAAWVGLRRAEAALRPTWMEAFRMLAAWIVSVPIVWSAGAAGIALAAGTTGAAAPVAANGAGKEACYRAEDYDRLAALPAGTVLAPSNLGAAILRYTPHRTFAGPYHRNVAGLLVALDAFTAPPAEALRIARAHRADFVAICPGNDESAFLANQAPHGLMAALLAGDAPHWLEPLAKGESPALRIYRVTAP